MNLIIDSNYFPVAGYVLDSFLFVKYKGTLYSPNEPVASVTLRNIVCKRGILKLTQALKKPIGKLFLKPPY